MSGISSSTAALAADAGKYVAPTLLLKKALDSDANTMTTLLAGLPQKDNAGKLVDVQA